MCGLSKVLLPTFTHSGIQGLTSGNRKLEKELLLYLSFLAPNSSEWPTSTLPHIFNFSKFRADKQHLLYLKQVQHSNEMISNTWTIFVHFKLNRVYNISPCFSVKLKHESPCFSVTI